MSRRPSVWYLDDVALTADPHPERVIIRGFIRGRSGSELVEVEYPDGSIRRRAFNALRRPLPRRPSADR